MANRARDRASPTRYSLFAIRRGQRGNSPLLPDRLVGVPALALQFLDQRLDRTGIVAVLGAFVIAARIVLQIELWARSFIGSGDDGAADPEHQVIGAAGLVGRHDAVDLDGVGEIE